LLLPFSPTTTTTFALPTLAQQ